MRRNSNYFGDLSQFFLRAKKEENFVLPPDIKNSLREKLSLKISEIKNPQTAEAETQQEQIQQPVAQIAEEAPAKAEIFGFWTLWKRQLISVPASLAALTLIVFAANNFNFSLQPKEDFSPRTPLTEKTSDLATSLLDTNVPEIKKPEITEDTVLISDAETEKSVTKNSDPLVLDINSMGVSSDGEIRTLNKYEPAENQGDQTLNKKPQTTVTSGNSDVSASQNASQDNSNIASTNTTQTNSTQTTTQSETAKTEPVEPVLISSTAETQTPVNTATSSQPATTAQTTTSTQGTADSQAATTQTPTTAQTSQTSNPASTTATESVAATQPVQSAQIYVEKNITSQPGYQLIAEQENNFATTDLSQITNSNMVIAENAGTLSNAVQPVDLSDYIKQSDVFVKTIKNQKYPVNYYSNSTVSSEISFDQSILSEITANKSPSSVNVYYLNSSNVLIEIIENSVKKLYLYGLKNGVWTTIKYEKINL